MVGTHATIKVEETATAGRTPQKKYTVKVTFEPYLDSPRAADNIG
jgi:hypothetical protein